MTVAGRFHRFIKEDDELPDPWTVSLGYTIPIANIFESVLNIPKAIVNQ